MTFRDLNPEKLYFCVIFEKTAFRKKIQKTYK